MSERALRNGFAAAAFGILVSLCLVLMIEGALSLLLGAREIGRLADRPQIEEMKHTRYDEELGWINLPGVSLADFYGTGRHFHTNGQGFRGLTEVSPQRVPGTRRIICSGDSFTLGYGVADEDTWCAWLASENPALETVNMGQGGYGIDQAFLWYQRDGRPLEHDAQILAFIFDDFRRVGATHMLGHGKPLLAIGETGDLTNLNHPVPDHGYARRWLIQNSRHLRQFRTVDFAARVAAKLRGGDDLAWARIENADEERIWAVVERIFEVLRKQHAALGSELVLVFLPAPWDHDTDLSSAWRGRVGMYAQRHDVRWVDLVAAVKELPAETAASLFLPKDDRGYPHMSPAGNQWVADRLAPIVAVPPR